MIKFTPKHPASRPVFSTYVEDREEANTKNSAHRPVGSFTNFRGMQLAVWLTEPFKDHLTPSEKYLLVVLFSTLTDADYIDHRVSVRRLAEFTGLSKTTVKAGMQKFYELGFFIVEDSSRQHHAPLLRLDVAEIRDFLGRWAGDAL